MRAPLYLLGGLFFLGCAPAAPDSPTWNEDVRPILTANCQRCHGYPPIHGAPKSFRVDVCDDWQSDGPEEESFFAGAQIYSVQIATRTGEKTMPPRFPLSDRQIEILANWADHGAPCGPPLPDNHKPTFNLIEQTDDGATVTFSYAILDPDLEVVIGELLATPAAGGDSIVITRELHDGIGEAQWDTATVTPGTYQLSAHLFDGSTDVTVDVGSVEVMP
ncbi:MAG TPA: hypothetical protein VFG83_04645 [Kofleriaceae bacterium]|nr:hypothetical protein [Kofleriaceae bacterium]